MYYIYIYIYCQNIIKILKKNCFKFSISYRYNSVNPQHAKGKENSNKMSVVTEKKTPKGLKGLKVLADQDKNLF